MDWCSPAHAARWPGCATPRSAEAYTRYRERTSIVLPLPPALYSRLPRCAKIALFDLPWFEYEPGSQHVIV